MDNIKILDCTLRDGGHVNNSDFGSGIINEIAHGLTKANIDYIEMGFLKNGNFSQHQSSCNDVKEMSEWIPDERGNTKYTAMIRPDWYDIDQLSVQKQKIDIIRFAFYYRDFELMSKYAQIIRDRGYGFICNPVNVMGYTDERLRKLVERLNKLQPEQLTIVDTYGALSYKDLNRIYNIIETDLDEGIRIGLHLHENQSLAYGLLHEFLRIKKSQRKTVIDASLLGMGRMPGNLCMEILASHMNDHFTEKYDLMEIYRLIGTYIEPLKTKYGWGYNPAYYLTGKMNMHRSYGEFLIDKGLDIYEIAKLLSEVPEVAKDEFNKDIIENIYRCRLVK